MERHIDLDGIQNFRDFGGYATACGRGLRSGVLYRSANHSKATDADLSRLAGLGVSGVIDLRQPKERSREPSRRWDSFAGLVVENDVDETHPDWESRVQSLDPTPEWFFADALDFYERAPFEPRHVDLFTRYFRTLAETDGAIIVHCAAGKDRTGLICALTHHLAGVGPDDIVADYLLTNDEARMAEKMRAIGAWMDEFLGIQPPEPALRVAVGVHPEYLERSFAAMSARHGSVDGYLEAALGVDAAMRERLHARLLGAA